MISTVFSENMRKFRLVKNYTQEEVAEKLGVMAQTVSRWECGTTLPDVLRLPEIAELYGVVVDDLFKKQSVAYENYAERLSSVYEKSRDPEDFFRCRLEYQKMMKTGEMSMNDKWIYAWLHHQMMVFCKKEALKWYDDVLSDQTQKNAHPYRRAASLKLDLLFSIGEGEAFIREQELKMKEAAGNLDEREWYLLIEAYDLAKQFDKAYAAFLKAIANYPDSWELYLQAGIVCEDMEQYDEAIAYYEKAGEIGTYFCDEKYQLARCYRKLERYKEAYRIYIEIAETHRKNGYEIEAEMALNLAKEVEDKIK